MNETNDLSIAELLYLSYFAIMLGAKAVGLYEGQMAYNVCLILGALFFFSKIIVTKHNLYELSIIVLLLLFGITVYLVSGEKSLLIFLTMMLGMKGVSPDRVFKLGGIIWGTAFVTMYILSVIGVVPEVAFFLDRPGWPPIIRHSLGYPHPNTLHLAYFILTIFALYSLRNLSKKYVTAIAVILMIGNCYVFMYSLSRYGFVITTLYIVLHLYLCFRGKKSNVERVIIELIFPFSALFMIIFPFIVPGGLFEQLDILLEGKLSSSKAYLSSNQIGFLGVKDASFSLSPVTIGSSYVYLLFYLGLLAFVLYFIAMIVLIHKYVDHDKKAELAVILALTIGGISETYLFNQSFKNLIFVFLGSMLFEISDTICSKNSASVLYAEHGLAVGERIVHIPRIKQGYDRGVPVNIWAFIAALFILVDILTSLIYVCCFPAPKAIYMPNKELISSPVEVYLDEDEAKYEKRQGNIIRGYVDQTMPLYRTTITSTIKVEYTRLIISYGLWSGSLITVAFLVVWLGKSRLRFFLKNRTIGDGYKENVLIVHNYYRIPGGEDVVVANEKKLLEEKGHKVILYTRNNVEAGDGNLFQKIGLVFVTIFNIRTYIDICRIIDKEKIDILHVHNTLALISPAVYIAGINRGVPVVQTVHNFRLVCPNGECYIRGHVCERCLEHGLKASLLYSCYRNSKLQTLVSCLTMKIQRMLLTYRSINYICLTEFNKEKILSLKQIKEENIYIKPNFTTHATTVIPYSERKNQIVYAGRIEKIKGIDILLQAWMKLGNAAPKLIICGKGELEQWCHEYIQNNEIENVEMRGQISNAEVKELIGESKAMIYPTQWYEGFPMAVAEAYTMGTPIIASDIGNVGNLVEDGITGLKFKCNSVVSLAKTIEKFESMSLSIPEEYLTRYTAENNYILLKGIYESVRSKS